LSCGTMGDGARFRERSPTAQGSVDLVAGDLDAGKIRTLYVDLEPTGRHSRPSRSARGGSTTPYAPTKTSAHGGRLALAELNDHQLTQA